MRYWAYLVAKVTVAGGILLVLKKWVALMYTGVYVMPGRHHTPRAPILGVDLSYTFAMMALSLAAFGLLWLIVWDQRNRCRTCLRWLRMPVGTGSWSHMLLLGRPKTEYICIYGHGTLKVADVQITGHENPDWQAHDDDIWKELAPRKPQPVTLPPEPNDLLHRPQRIYSLGETQQ